METVNELEIDYSNLLSNNIIRNAGQDAIKVAVLGTSEDDFETDTLQSLQVKQQLSSQSLSLNTEEYSNISDYWFL